MREKFESFNREENNEEEDFNEKNALLPFEEQEELNRIRKKQINGELSPKERERFLSLQEKENKAKGKEKVSEKERERYMELVYKKELNEEEHQELARIQAKMDKS